MLSSCFHDHAFILSVNESTDACMDDFNGPLQTVLYSILALVLLTSLVISSYGAWLTHNAQARYHLLTFNLPTLYVAVISIMIACGMKTGKDGVAIVILFGLYVSTFVIILQYVGNLALKRLALISVQALNMKQQQDMFKSPRLRAFETVMLWIVLTLAFGSFVCLSILYPLAPVAHTDYWVTWTDLHQRAFYWDFGVFLSFIVGGICIMIVSFANLWVIISSLETAKRNVQHLVKSSSSVEKSAPRSSMDRVIFKLKLGMWGTIPAGGFSAAMGVIILYSTTVMPRYYLMFLYFMTTIVFAQYWTIIMFHPGDVLGLQRKVFGSLSGTSKKRSQRVGQVKNNNNNNADTALSNSLGNGVGSMVVDSPRLINASMVDARPSDLASSEPATAARTAQ